jgi:hypothetical protein
MLFHLLDLSIVNACALEKKVWNKKKVEVVVFQLDLAREILEKFHNSTVGGEHI